MRIWHLKDERGNKVATIVSTLNPDSKTVEFAVSSCNPIDQFDPSQGISLATWRLMEGKDSGTVIVQPRYTNKAILEHIVNAHVAEPTTDDEWILPSGYPKDAPRPDRKAFVGTHPMHHVVHQKEHRRHLFGLQARRAAQHTLNKWAGIV